jgi:transposase
MLSFFSGLKIYASVDAVDLRKSFEGLSAIIQNILDENPSSGSLYIFTNQRRNRVKLFYWDGTGLWVMTKRLEKGTFFWPKKKEGQTKLSLTPESMALLLDGVDLRQGTLRPWYERE